MKRHLVPCAVLGTQVSLLEVTVLAVCTHCRWGHLMSPWSTIPLTRFMFMALWAEAEIVWELQLPTARGAWICSKLWLNLELPGECTLLE